MQRYVLLSFLPAVINLGLGVYVWSRNSEARENRLLALGCFGLSIYSFRIFEVYSRPVEEAEFIYSMLAFSPILAVAFLSDFLLTLSKRPLFFQRWREISLIYGPAILLSVSYAFTDWIFRGFTVMDTGEYNPLPGPLVGPPIIYMVSLLLFALVQAVRTLFSTADLILRKQLFWSMAGIGISTLTTNFIVLSDEVPQLLGVNAAFCTTLVAGTMVYAIAKYGLAPSIEELRRREEQLRRENAEALAREAELSRQVLDAQIREERLRHQQAEMEARHRQVELERELQTAHDMQMSLMPKESPKIEGFDVAGRCIPANQVGGDYFQYFSQNDKLILSLADVTGHAMEAAIPVVMFSGILKSHMELGGTLQERFQRLNRSLHGTLTGRTLVCFVMGELDPSTRTFRLSDSGCPYPYHYRAAAGEVVELQVDAYPLGVRPDTVYLTAETQLQPGDRVIFCSDGIMEATNVPGEQFGYDRTAEMVRKACEEGLSAEAMIGRLLEAVDAFRGDAPQSDDMTCVVVRVEE